MKQLKDLLKTVAQKQNPQVPSNKITTSRQVTACDILEALTGHSAESIKLFKNTAPGLYNRLRADLGWLMRLVKTKDPQRLREIASIVRQNDTVRNKVAYFIKVATSG